MVKLIVKTIVINGKIHNNKRKRFNLLIQKYRGKLLQSCTDEIPGEIVMYLPIDYNCFYNQLYHNTKIICKKRVTCKKKQGDFNFAL
jgi:hypothetical protein